MKRRRKRNVKNLGFSGFKILLERSFDINSRKKIFLCPIIQGFKKMFENRFKPLMERGVITMKTINLRKKPSTFFITLHTSNKVRFIALLTVLFFLVSPININLAYAQTPQTTAPEEAIAPEKRVPTKVVE